MIINIVLLSTILVTSAVTIDTAHPGGEIRQVKESKAKITKGGRIKTHVRTDDNQFISDQTFETSGNVCHDERSKVWHLIFTNVFDAWDYSLREGKPSGGDGIVIAQVDSGYSDHSCFDGVFADENKKGLNYYNELCWLFCEDYNDPKDTSFGPGAGHGTVVASAALNRGDNNGPPGTAPNATLFSMRVINNPAMAVDDITRMIRAFDDIADLPTDDIHVASMSIGMQSIVPLGPSLEISIKRAIEAKNIIVVAAAGQFVTGGDAGGGAMNPSRMDDVLAVGGVDKDNNYFGNRGEKVHIAAPALNVCNAQSNSFGTNPNAYGPGQGTSIATAMTGGIAALWLAHHGRDYLIQEFSAIDKTLNQAFMKVVEKTAQTPVGWTRNQGHGIIDAFAILEMDVSTIKLHLQEENR